MAPGSRNQVKKEEQDIIESYLRLHDTPSNQLFGRESAQEEGPREQEQSPSAEHEDAVVVLGPEMKLEEMHPEDMLIEPSEPDSEKWGHMESVEHMSVFAKAPPLPDCELEELLLPVEEPEKPELLMMEEQEDPQVLEERRCDLAVLVDSFKVFQSSIEVVMNYHRIRQRRVLTANIEAIYQILRKECRKMESSLNEELAEVMREQPSRHSPNHPMVKLEVVGEEDKGRKGLKETREDMGACKLEQDS